MSKSSTFLGLLLTGAVLVMGVGAAQVATSGAAWADDNDHEGGGEPNDNLPVYLDRRVHPTAQGCVSGSIWQGSGNPDTTFQRKRDLDAGVELAIKAILRGGADIRSTYVDGNGLVHIEVPAGPQPTVSNRAAWNFTYSYDVALDPSNPNLDRYDARLWIDLDPSKKTRYLKLKLATGGPVQAVPCVGSDLNGYQWKSGNTVVIPDDEGTPKVTQNSQNYAFYITAIGDTDPHTPGVQLYNFGPGEFDVVLALREKSNGHSHDDDDEGDGEWTILHVVFNVVTASTQTP